MSEIVLGLLQAYKVAVVQAEQIQYPIQASQGLHRVLVVAGDNIEEMLEEAADGEDSIRSYVEEQLIRAESLSVSDVLKKVVADSLADSGLPTIDHKQDDLRSAYKAYAALWAEQPELMDEQLVNVEEEGSVLQEPLPNAAWVERNEEGELLLLDLPEADAWTAPLTIPMGGYNECPQPVEQAALFRDWQKRYGAVPTAVSEDSWLLRASRLPESDEEALELAREHFMFCSYVLEGFASIGAYAAYLKRSSNWSFWWD
ncbi:DUF4253 domain-containing protein [Saccharibacillus sacchari]|uniref:DUF4253 domain-containing protein n=1 Tax=Saccharibacillus sacchari TaxID=456493 RepID=UPI0004B71F4B|nr:DUF4253 domain-containing protein [Saccharibacillus sacchari]